jgi:tetrahydromethanopterin S-methyltransferase subunit G
MEDDTPKTIEELARMIKRSFDSVDKRFDRVEAHLTKIEAEIRGIREMLGTPDAPKVITHEEYVKLDARLRKIEEHLKLVPA